MAISWEETKATTEQLLQEAVAFTAVSAEDFRTHRGIYILSYCGRELGGSPWQDPQPEVVYLGHTGEDSFRHWQNSTGYSTLRRSLAAMLATTLDLHAIPRNKDPEDTDRCSNYALDAQSEETLSRWMADNLRCAFLDLDPSQEEEWFEALMDYNAPMFVFQQNPNNHYGVQIKQYRARLIEEAERVCTDNSL